MSIANLCEREVVGILATASVHEAAVLMCEQHVGSLVVVTGEQPPQVVGVLTDRDLALDVLGRREQAGQELRAGDLAKSPPLAVRSDVGLREAATAMEEAGVRRLLVVDDDGGVIGLVAAEDLLAAISEELAAVVRALGSSIRREKGERKVMTSASGARPVFPGVGIAVQ